MVTVCILIFSWPRERKMDRQDCLRCGVLRFLAAYSLAKTWGFTTNCDKIVLLCDMSL